MQYQEFIRTVEKYGNIWDFQQAEKVTKVVIKVLLERVYRSKFSDLVSQLPKELKDYLKNNTETEKDRYGVKYFDLENFYIRVHSEANLNYNEAKRYAHAVVQTLRDAISSGEWNQLLEELPKEFKEDFSFK